MPLKTIVVHVDNSPATPARLAVAIALAEQHDAHLVGVHPCDPWLLPIYFEPSMEMIEAQKRWAEEETARSRKLFQQVVAKASSPAEWCETGGDAARVTAMHARHGDLLVLGQQYADAPTFGTPSTLVEDLLFASGRPVLVVPFIGGKAPFRRILVAWNASREAARAVNDALPLLQRAEQVTVLAINPEKGLDGHGDSPCADICLHMARHGIKTEAAQTRAEDIDAGEVLLSRASDLGSDLIVMGAYGHSRLRETVLGGVTRTILRHMNVPVLLSH